MEELTTVATIEESMEKKFKEDEKEEPIVIATIDEALEKTHYGKYNIQLIIFSGLVLNNVILESVGISFALPVIACDLDLSYQEQGILGAVCFLGIIISSHLWGFLADTKGRKETMKPALLLAFLVTLISSFSINFIMIAVLRFINGILISAGSATIFAYLGEFHSQKKRNKAIMCAALISAFSAIFLPIIALGIAYTTSRNWRLYLIVCGLSGLVCFIILGYLPESPKYLLGLNRPKEVLDILKIMHRKNTKGNKNLKDENFTITTILPDLDTPLRKKSVGDKKSITSILHLIWNQTAPLFMRQHIRKTCLSSLIQFITLFTAHGIYMWFPYVLNSTMLYTQQYEEPLCLCDILRVTQSANFSNTNSLDNELNNTCTTKLEISTYKHTITLEVIYMTLMLCVIFAIVILALSGIFGILSLIIKIPLVAIYMIALMLCSGLATIVMSAVVVDIYPTNLRAMAVCISLMLGRIGSVSGSYVLGALIESHCELAFYTSSFALIMADFGKFNIKLIVFSGLVLNNVILESVGVSFALPVVACDLNLSYQEQGILGAVCFLGIIFSSHLWGFLADTKGRKRTMRPTLFLAFLVTFVSSFSFNFIMMAILRFLNGILISAGSATIFAYLGEFHSQKDRNKAILCGALMSAFSAVFFPIIAWLFINQEWEFDIPFLPIVYKPWRLYFLMCGVSGLGCCIFLGYLPESPKYLLGVNKTEEALDVLKEIHRKNTQGNKNLKNENFTITTLLPDLDTPIRKQSIDNPKSATSMLKLIWDQTAPLFMRQHIRKTCLAAVIQFIIFFTAHGVYMWFPYILNNVMLYTQHYDDVPLCLCDILRFTQSSNFSIPNSLDDNLNDKICTTKLEISTYRHTITLEFIYIFLLICVIFANKKFKRTPILFTILATCGLFGILSLLISIPLVAIYMLVITLCCGLGTSVMNTIVVDIYPTNLRAMAVCISLMLGRIGSVTGSNVMGALIETHCEAALYSSSTALILAGCLGFLMPKTQHNKKSIEDNERS
ncbi:Synaptic vesicle glycoprotein 2B [Lucilia cuprina]|nr:Synaptic vesicle glycoprotein 2B [Lucilia cuprina]